MQGDPTLEETFRIGEEHYPWIKDQPDASVTELELRHVLKDIGKTDVSCILRSHSIWLGT